MSTPASKPEFSKGVVEPVGDCGMFEAAIDHLTTDNNVMTPHGPDTDASKPPQDWGGRILMYGKTAEQATALRERILVALEQRLAQAVDMLGQAQVFVEQGDDDSQAWMDLSSGISNVLAIASAPAIEPGRQVTDGGRNPRYEGLFEGETEEQRASRLAPATEQPAKLCMGCVEQSSRIRELEHKMDYYRAASPAAGTETLPFWEPCNPGCDPEFNGQRSKWCAQLCHPAREALSVSAGGVDERAAFEAWYLGYFYMGDKQCGLEWLSTEPCGGYRHQHPAEQWIVWQARAALSAPSHSEQVREVPGAFLEAARQADDVLTAIIRNNEPIATLERTYGKDWHEAVGKIRTALILQIAAAPAAPAADAGLVDMYRHLQTVTPYRFKKIQDASVTDGGDVLYFHKDRFDAALLDDMAANCAKESK